jgi:hypothetical protein
MRPNTNTVPTSDGFVRILSLGLLSPMSPLILFNDCHAKGIVVIAI